MRVERVEVEEYSGAVAGARSATGRWDTRRGFLLRVRTPDGIVAQGEASPLPGYSGDSYDDVARCLRAVDWGSMPEPDPTDTPSDVLERLRTIGNVAAPAASVFALETAFLDLAGQRAGRPIWSLLPGTATGSVSISSLVGGVDDPDIVAAAEAAANRGVSAIKMKISGAFSEERLSRILAVRSAVGEVPLRLDANGSLALKDALQTLRALANAGVEFIEEPVSSADLPLLEASPVAVALDESLQSPDTWPLLEPHLKRIGCVALVLKPMALGGFGACLEWASRARAHGLETTISHVFDGPVALTACAHLALAVGSRRYGSGLDPHGGLGAWPEAPLVLHSQSTVVRGDRPGLGMAPLSRGAA